MGNIIQSMGVIVQSMGIIWNKGVMIRWEIANSKQMG